MPDQQPHPRPSEPEPDLVLSVPSTADNTEAPVPGTAAGQASACAARVLSTFEAVVRAAESEEVRVVERACRLVDAGADSLPSFAGLQRNSELAGGTEGFPGADEKNGLPAVVEARLAQVVQRNRTAIAGALVPLVTVGEERSRPLGEVVGDVQLALDRFRLELVHLCNQCVDFRLRSVELLNDLQVGALHVEKPLFEV